MLLIWSTCLLSLLVLDVLDDSTAQNGSLHRPNAEVNSKNDDRLAHDLGHEAAEMKYTVYSGGERIVKFNLNNPPGPSCRPMSRSEGNTLVYLVSLPINCAICLIITTAKTDNAIIALEEANIKIKKTATEK